MNAETIIKKYGLKLVEKDGRKGVAPSFGKVTAADVDYIRSHKDEITAALTAPKQTATVTLTAADLAYVKVSDAEYVYHQAERNADSNAKIIAARDAYWKALDEWTAQYPEAAKKYSNTIKVNEFPADPWNN